MSDRNVSGTSAMQPQREVIRIDASTQQSPQKLRVAGYARVSSDSADQLNSFTAQVTHYTKVIAKNSDWQFVDVYADEGITGVSTTKRDEFNRMVSDCREGLIDRILTKSISRFSRNTVDTLAVLRELRMLEVSVYFEKEKIDTAKTSSEELTTIYAMFAQQESESISQNCKRGIRGRMKNGTYIASSVPYGYRLIDGVLQIHEQEATVVRAIFQSCLEGKGLLLIAQELSNSEVKNKHDGMQWSINTIAGILRNEKYIGDVRFQKSYKEDCLPYKPRLNRGELPQYYVRNSHEGIVSNEIFELVNERLLSRNTVQGEYQIHLLSKKIRCKCCGASYHRKVNRDKIYWVCRVQNLSLDRCNTAVISEKSIYDAFIRMYNKLQLHHKSILSPMLTDFERLQELQQKSNTELKTLNKEIAKLAEQNHVLTELVSKGILDSALFLSQSDELNRQLSRYKKRKAKILASTRQDDVATKTESLIAALRDAKPQISQMDETLFEDIVEKIIACDKKRITFVLSNRLKLTERLDG